MEEEVDLYESHSPIPEESEDNIQYIIVDPRSLSDDESASSKKRPRWEQWETKELINVMKDQNNRHRPRTKENFFLLEQEMKKRGVDRWDSNQIQQKWRNMRKEWLGTRGGGQRTNGMSRAVTEFQDELDELLGTNPANYSLSGIDTTSGEDIIGLEVDTLEPIIHVDIIEGEDEKSPVSPVYYPEESARHDVKPSTSSEDGQDLDSAHEQSFKGKKLKTRDTITQSKKDLFTWPHAGVLHLLKQYKKQEHEFVLGKRQHNKIWNDIAKAICSINTDLNVTGNQCRQKISGLKRTYSSIKEQRPLAGGEKITWPYFPIVDKVFGSKPPGHCFLGSKMPRKVHTIPPKRKLPSSSSSDEGDQPGVSSVKRSRVETILEQYIRDVKKQRELLSLKRERRAEEKARKREEMEKQKMEQRRKMHEEKMMMQKAALDILKQILLKNK